MDKKILDSLDKFYENNGINPDLYTASEIERYIGNKRFDPKITRDNLKEKVGCWIERFEEEDKQYFLSLLQKYVYISQNEFQHRIYNLCTYIYGKLEQQGIEKTQVLFVTVPSLDGVMSGGDALRNALREVNAEWLEKDQVVSDISRVNDSILNNKKAIIFIDDILGTGFSLRGTIEQFIDKFSINKVKNCRLGIASVLMTKHAVDYIKSRLKKLDLDVYAQPQNYIRSCMKGGYIFSGNEVKKIEEIILNYEKEIGMDMENGKDYAMGFKACKLLLSFYYNTPNNTLCTFWKYTGKNIPLFPRDKYKTMTIDALKSRKKTCKDNAYRKGCVDDR